MAPIIGIAMDTGERGFTLGLDYARAIEAAGGVAWGIPPAAHVEAILANLQSMHGLLLPGGNDVDPFLYGEETLPENGSLEPARDALELPLARWALQRGVPILGICRGMQVMNVAAGGTLFQDIPSQTRTRLQHRQKAPRWHATHSIDITADSLLYRALGVTSVRVNTFHHQAVREVAAGFVVSARARDGIVEAIEAPDHPFALGVQWHPEAMCERDTVQAALFTHFVGAARSYLDAARDGGTQSAGDRAV